MRHCKVTAEMKQETDTQGEGEQFYYTADTVGSRAPAEFRSTPFPSLIRHACLKNGRSGLSCVITNKRHKAVTSWHLAWHGSKRQQSLARKTKFYC